MSTVEPPASPVDLASVVQQFPAFIAVYEGPELRCVLANAVARGIVGGRAFEGLPLREALPEFETQQIVDLVEQVYERGEAARAEEWRVQLANPSGGDPIEVFATFDAVPWRHADGSLRGVITTGMLVTEMVVARRAADSQVADLADRYRRVRADVAELQRVLLPTRLPVVPSAQVAAFYRVAGSEDAAGGDWFDCILVPGDRLAIVVGDVVGHGIEASAGMAQLRAVLAELLAEGEPLPAIVGRLDRFARRVPQARSATVCIAVFDPATATVDYCTLGHPAPLLVDAAGRGRFLPLTGGTPLASAEQHAETGSATLGPDEVLLLYTDGLVERPGEDLDAGLQTLARVAGDAAAGRLLPAGAPASAADRVGALTVEVLTRSGTADDVTLVVLQRRAPEPAPLTLTIERPEQLHTVRAAVAGWLAPLGVDEDPVADAQLMVTEAMTNALEHAYPDGRGGAVTLVAELVPSGRIRCTVSDRGTWRAPGALANRGRGLSLIRALGAELRVEAGETGTEVGFTLEPFRSAVLIGAPPPRELVEAAFAAEVSLDPRPAVRVHGVVDTTTAPSLAAAIGRAGRGGTRTVLVDLTECQQLASAGVRVLLEAAATEGGLRLVARPGRGPHTVLQLVGLAGLLDEQPA